MQPKPPIIIAGFTHCGSSFLADRLQAAGIQMHSGECDAHFECRELVKIADAEQARGLCGYSDNGLGLPIDYKPSDDFIKQLQAYRRKRELANMASPLAYGVKEPRITAYLAAYARVWPDAIYMWATRNPIRAAATRIRRMRAEVDDKRKLAAMPSAVEMLRDYGAACEQAMRTVVKYRLGYPFFYERDTTSADEQVIQEKILTEMVGTKVELAAHWAPDAWGKSGNKEY